MKRGICFLIAVFFSFNGVCAYAGVEENINAKSCILIEQSTGNVLYEMNADERLPIASVTKVMTMLLIMEEINAGRLKYDDMVTVSENAMSYGGSTMFLETGEQLSVNDMLKGIAVASANDGCVAMAEHIAGSESSFVDMMNSKARELGMENTNFMNTNGLDEENHYSSARDVAIMSRALLNYSDITNYTSIWTDELRDGKFQLANTNKLIRFYTGANGLKTGSTSAALCCLSASAVRDGMQLIAVVLGAPTSSDRFSSAKALLDHGFAGYKINQLIAEGDEVCETTVQNGVEPTVKLAAKSDVSLLEEKSKSGECERQVHVNETVIAPIHKGDVLGTVDFVRGGEVISSAELCAADDVDKRGFAMVIRDIIYNFL